MKKKGKDKRLIKNWRPISLINVDAKIASKALAKRLEKALPEIIHFNQNAFVKGRTIFDAIRTIEDVIEHTKQNGLAGILVAIDFEKAFDTLNFNYLIRILHEFNFGPSFIQWIRVLYNNASSCVMNHGFSTGPFPLGRGVGQGDPLSPYLFIMALEVLAIRVRNDDSIQGFKIGDEIIRLSLFADDMTCFLKDKLSYINLFRLLKAFGECSGLKVNHEKTEALALGDNSLWEDLSNMHTLCNVIKILGIHFGGNDKERDDLNFRETLKSIKKSRNLWKWRGLSLLGRIQIIKTFAIPKLMFRASVIPISKELIKNADSIFYSFIWNGKDKVKRNVLSASIENGGLNMLDIDSMIRTKRVICIKKYLEDYRSPWKFFLEERLSSVGGSFALHCNFNTSKLLVKLPPFYKQCFDAWSDLNTKAPTSLQEVVNEIIWNNKFLCVNNKSVFRRVFFSMGLLKIGDLLSGDIPSTFCFMNLLLTPEQRFFVMSIIDSIPAHWRTIIKEASSTPIVSPVPDAPTILIDENPLTIVDVSSKQMYRLFQAKKQVLPTAQKKLSDKYPHSLIEWEKVYSLSFRSTLESKLREFQYKILNCIVFTNEKLFRFGITQSPLCTFCQKENESIEHLLFSCKETSEFWKHVLSWLRDNNISVVELKEADLTFGKFDVQDDFTLLNHILLLGKYYIYSRKCQNAKPSLKGFIAKTKRVYRIELYISRKRDKLAFHLKKWEKLIKDITN